MIGPFSKQISFASQQRRALNLVSAMHRAEIVRTGKRVAVVGAGLAGVTAAAALIGYGCEVEVIDREATWLSQFEHSTHRHVHPSINHWPREPLSLTTTLPFFDWAETTAATVAFELHSEATAILSARFVANTVVERIHSAGEHLVLGTHPPLPNPNFDAIVLAAAGFGQVGNEGMSYWEPDGLEAEIVVGKINRVVISGCEDGGLTDALRSVHSKFEGGRLAVGIAEMLNDAAVVRLIDEGERFVRETNDPRSLGGDCQDFRVRPGG